MKLKDENFMLASLRHIETKVNMLDFKLEVFRGLLYLCLQEKNFV